MQVRIGVLVIAREREVLVLADHEVIELQRTRLGIKPVLGLSLGEESIIDSRSVLMETGLVEQLVKVDLALLAPADDVKEAAAPEPHLILLLLHNVLEGKLAVDLAGAGKVALALDTVVDHDGLLEELRVLLEDEVVHGLLADRCRRQPFH